MKDQYAEIISCLATPKGLTEIANECEISIGSLHQLLYRLLDAGMVERTKKKIGKRQPTWIYSRLVDSVTRDDVIKKPEETPVNPFARVIAERHVPSEKKKSPRVHIGCSFGLSGW